MKDIAEIKKEFRRRALATRDAIPDRERLKKSADIALNLRAYRPYQNAKSVLYYISVGSEVDTRYLIDTELAKRRVIVPKVNFGNDCLELYEISSLEELLPGYRSIPEPPPDTTRKVDPANIDLLIIPGLAFDLKGFRLGYGGGFFDKLLEKAPSGYRTALAFEAQLHEEIPHDKNDQKVDCVVTEKRVIDFRCSPPVITL